MGMKLTMSGLGHALGSTVVSNTDLAGSLGLASDWFVQRTGIEQRRVCGEGEDALSLAAAAVTRACEDARLDMAGLGHETVLMHIQNGFTHFTPPAGVVLAGNLGMSGVRVVGLDGVCAEPIAALDLGTMMLQSARCDRVIISAAVDFLSYVNPGDPDTAGLFGAGAGAVVLSREPGPGQQIDIHGMRWESHAEHWRMGEVRIERIRQNQNGVQINSSFYEMRGQRLYRTALRILPGVIGATLETAGWSRDEIDLIVIHQPNPRLLELAARPLRLNLDVMPRPSRLLGNMGPASLLVNLSLARDGGRLAPGTRALLLAFGLGFSCGAAAVRF
jgi:3-oxoacyl-[acyl-carrier-protein] synthase-3